jgi:hypothetical protein
MWVLLVYLIFSYIINYFLVTFIDGIPTNDYDRVFATKVILLSPLSVWLAILCAMIHLWESRDELLLKISKYLWS